MIKAQTLTSHNICERAEDGSSQIFPDQSDGVLDKQEEWDILQVIQVRKASRDLFKNTQKLNCCQRGFNWEMT